VVCGNGSASSRLPSTSILNQTVRFNNDVPGPRPLPTAHERPCLSIASSEGYSPADLQGTSYKMYAETRDGVRFGTHGFDYAPDRSSFLTTSSTLHNPQMLGSRDSLLPYPIHSLGLMHPALDFSNRRGALICSRHGGVMDPGLDRGWGGVNWSSSSMDVAFQCGKLHLDTYL
jgi:hypothetical protein